MAAQQSEFDKLESALFRAGRALNYPATPAIAARVRSELASTGVDARATFEPKGQRVRIPRLVVAVVIAILLALALLVALPGARQALSQFLGLPNLKIFYVTPTSAHLPTSTPRPGATQQPTPEATPTVAPFTLCCEITLAGAQARSKFQLLVPPGEAPTRVYFQDIYGNGAQVVMIFGDPDHPRFTLYQAQRWIYAKLVGEQMGKVVGPQTVIGEAQVRGTRALWFSGAPHVVMMLDRTGAPVYSTARTVDANTLVWETGNDYDGVIYRVETMASLAEAVKFAQALVRLP